MFSGSRRTSYSTVRRRKNYCLYFCVTLFFSAWLSLLVYYTFVLHYPTVSKDASILISYSENAEQNGGMNQDPLKTNLNQLKKSFNSHHFKDPKQKDFDLPYAQPGPKGEEEPRRRTKYEKEDDNEKSGQQPPIQQNIEIQEKTGSNKKKQKIYQRAITSSTEKNDFKKKLQENYVLQRLPNTAIVMLTYNRPEYLRESLNSLLQDVLFIEDYPVFVSQHSNIPDVTSVIENELIQWNFYFDSEGGFHKQEKIFYAPQKYSHLSRKSPNIERIREMKINPLNHLQTTREELPNTPISDYITQHYRSVMNMMFDELGYENIILLEDDMIFSPDFLLFFEQTYYLLEDDPTLWCISSWNDNGFEYFDLNAKTAFRTSYFPGLGWLMTQSAWNDMSDIFPVRGHWDHWVRLNNKGRDCVVPDLSRNYNIGRFGSNIDAQYYDRLFQNHPFNTKLENFDLGNLDYLYHSKYEEALRSLIRVGIVKGFTKVPIKANEQKIIVLPYKREEHHILSEKFKIWTPPRSHFKYVQLVKYEGNVYILTDKRNCPFLGELISGSLGGGTSNIKLEPHPRLKIISSNRTNEDCFTLCKSNGFYCDDTQFDWINTCEQLQKYFKCEKGCLLDISPENPSYVVKEKSLNFKYCMIRESFPVCNGRSSDSFRLCPCVPVTLLKW